MQTILHEANKRGSGDYGWLSTHYSFSFADWYDPTRMGFGALRVLNDDIIAPSSGFGMHGHRDMEIITIVTEGAVTHKDSMGNEGVVSAGEVQVMSAGMGVLHSEYNASPSQDLALLQIWITPKNIGIPPRYETRHMNFLSHTHGLLPLINGNKDTLTIEQDASISYGAISHDDTITISLQEGHGVYLFVLQGEVQSCGIHLSARDALGVSDTPIVAIQGITSSTFLLIEVPYLIYNKE